jgi:hypothetical protein
MAELMAPISWGELFDKISILEIKAERIGHPAQVTNVLMELAALRELAAVVQDKNPELIQLATVLKHINTSIWETEDALRECEQRGEFNSYFINLARNAYLYNDQRFSVKQDINRICQSDVIEEKFYTHYTNGKI